tara:strand:+ start:34676 stop:36787 length:2112 start_codon:yes stop_codon:yes gene_type:complete
MSLYQVTDGVAVITLDRPPLNTLGLPLRRHLANALFAAQSDSQVNAIVLKGAGRGFSAGGDITEFDQPDCDQEPSPRALHDHIEASHKPVVAALHGMALGGGLELALACHARVAHSTTQVGLPEVHLGLVPGAGGTQRLPRLTGPEKALNMILSGRTFHADTLAESGLFDAVTTDDVEAQAITLAITLATAGTISRTGEQPCNMDNAQAFFAYARSTLRLQPGASTAPLDCVDCVEAATLKSFHRGQEQESNTFRNLRNSPQFEGLRHVFLAERKALTPPGKAQQVKPLPLNTTAVIGGGTMGTGIAMAMANAGIPVVLVERDDTALARALTTIRDHYEGSAKRGKLSAEKAAANTALISGATDYSAVSDCDLIIEAVFEDIAVKCQVFERLDAIAKPEAILATNTSMLDVNRIAQFTRRPQSVVGLHFFSPAHIMKLLEIVQGDLTSAKVMATALALGKKIGKTSVVSGVCEGFIGNRMLQPYLMQAGMLLDEGALPQQIDSAIEKWGMAMGPFRMCDMAGNDLGGKIREQHLVNHPQLVYSRCFIEVEAMGRFGQKVGRGWYDYIPGQRAPGPSEEVNAAVIAESARLGLQRRFISDEEIVGRLLLALVNEGARILEEGIAQRASDIDVVYTAGYGFPSWRGGPMFQAQQRGLVDVLTNMSRFANGPTYQKADVFWSPAPLLSRLAANGESLFNVQAPEAV